MDRYRINRKQNRVTDTQTGSVLVFVPPIANVSGEVFRLNNLNRRTELVWKRDGSPASKNLGVWVFDDILHDDRLEYLFDQKPVK